MTDTKLIDLTISDFIKELASDKPAPGGGSVSALGGALAAALTTMVGNLTVGKEKYSDVQEEMEELVVNATEFYKTLNTLIDEDTEAFNQVMSAYRMPKDKPEIRSKAIQEALTRAAEIPFKVAKTSFEVLDLVLVVAEKGNKNAITDAGVAALFAESSIRGALFNVKINIMSIKDEEVKSKFSHDMNDMLAQLASKREAIMKVVEAELA